VPVKNEIDYMQNLIGFYKMKSPGERKIKFTSHIENMDIRIAPMLFIPFIENSFKYSRIEEDKNGYINIDLTETSGKVIFTIENSIFSARKIMSGSGKGIMNVQQRLEIIYPGKHLLSMDHKEGNYTVTLQIDVL
jgi:two-component system LytT family sensor kinase